MKCYCGSMLDFNKCCEPLIQLQKIAESPEQLMRSRYTAYATKHNTYIYNTYAKKSRKEHCIEDISTWANQTSWIHLNVINCSPYKNLSLPTVEFEATYYTDNKFYKMKERSRFTREDGEWKYLDGDDLNHSEINTPKRNDPCLCLSGIKFKKCCG